MGYKEEKYKLRHFDGVHFCAYVITSPFYRRDLGHLGQASWVPVFHFVGSFFFLSVSQSPSFFFLSFSYSCFIPSPCSILFPLCFLSFLFYFFVYPPFLAAPSLPLFFLYFSFLLFFFLSSLSSLLTFFLFCLYFHFFLSFVTSYLPHFPLHSLPSFYSPLPLLPFHQLTFHPSSLLPIFIPPPILFFFFPSFLSSFSSFSLSIPPSYRPVPLPPFSNSFPIPPSPSPLPCPLPPQDT